MPLPDNVYSANDSDHESFSDELSPSDGYFGRGEMPRRTVTDPSVEDTKPEPKVLVPISNRQAAGVESGSRTSLNSILPQPLTRHNYASPRSNTNASTSSAYSTSSPSNAPVPPASPRRGDILSEQTPLINGPPPAYSRNPEPLIFHSNPNNDPTYSRLPEHYLEHGYLLSRDPQSMGRAAEEPSETTPLSGQPVRGHPAGKFTLWKALRKILFAVFVIAFIFTISMTIVRRSKPGSGTAPENGMPPFIDRPQGSPNPYCTSATHKNPQDTYDFPAGSNITILQLNHDSDSSAEMVNVRTTGEVRFRRLPKDFELGNRAYITVDARVSDPSLEVIRTWDEEYGLLKVSTPRYAHLRSHRPPCISLEITAWIPADASFRSITVQTISLTLRVFDDTKLYVTGEASLATISGAIYFPTTSFPPDLTTPFSSRRISVETISGSIHGCYPLFDFLLVASQSGNIKISVSPQSVDPNAPAPANLDVSTSSGSIQVYLPIQNATLPTYLPPPRNYLTRVHSSSGSLSGTYYIGSASSFRTTSGGIFLTGLPVLQNALSPQNTFETRTISGTIRVDIKDPIFLTLLYPSEEQPPQIPYPERNAPASLEQASLFAIDSWSTSNKAQLRNLRSVHETTSALVQLRYPDAWVGNVHAKTISGNIEVKGEGVKIVSEKKGYAFREVFARRGVDNEEGSQVEMADISGGLRFAVGI